MKTIRHLLLFLLLATGLSLAAQAQPGPGGGRFMRERSVDGPRQMPARRDGASGRESRDERGFRDERKSRDDRPGNDDRRKPLTPEERRQLRRDIHDAGRDIYRPERGPSRQSPLRPGNQPSP